jgi:hypothetical protein
MAINIITNEASERSCFIQCIHFNNADLYAIVYNIFDRCIGNFKTLCRTVGGTFNIESEWGKVLSLQ